ncbi:hypothetical protein F5879DRAFT_929990 [Lentinula edodes]|nr:uncharacterized protein C8R40DRAFT_293500 [Lentinula edodes]KAH7874621.1 hypothetical protein C8R40DRAFT_293500 [Lentinula edodes]KAJ3910325.1 hypothetical protein F5879DRAFT_929990 [Lentinula edodes]
MSTFHQLMTLDQSSTNFTQPPIPTAGPATEPDGPRSFAFVPTLGILVPHPPPPVIQVQRQDTLGQDPANAIVDASGSVVGNFNTGAGANHYPSSAGVPRLPPILQVEKQQVTTSATQLASASRRRNEANFACPVPGCGSTFTRRFNLRGHLRSHTEERPFVCEWPGCNKGFARQHDCKRHQALHTSKPQSNVCQGCKKTFSRLDALNRHLRSDGGAECRAKHTMKAASADQSGPSQLPPAILHIPLQTAQSPPQVPPKLQVPP